MNDLDRYDFDHVINLSDFLDSNDEDGGRSFVPHQLGDFEYQDDQDELFGEEQYERPNLSRPMTHNPALRNGSFDHRPDCKCCQ